MMQPEWGRIQVHRKFRAIVFDANWIAFKVMIDGQRAAQLWWGQTAVIPVPPGPHAVKIDVYGGWGSRTLDVDVKPGKQVNLVAWSKWERWGINLGEVSEVERQREFRRQARRQHRRPHRHTIRLSDEQQTQIAAAAEAAGMTVPDLFVETVLTALAGDGRLSVADQRALAGELLAVCRLLKPIDAKLSQLSAVANTTGQLPPEFEPTTRLVAAMVNRLDAALAPAEHYSRRPPRSNES
jgi:hypothetical protein